jgi:hypothetical protein
MAVVDSVLCVSLVCHRCAQGLHSHVALMHKGEPKRTGGPMRLVVNDLPRTPFSVQHQGEARRGEPHRGPERLVVALLIDNLDDLLDVPRAVRERARMKGAVAADTTGTPACAQHAQQQNAESEETQPHPVSSVEYHHPGLAGGNFWLILARQHW